MDSCISFLLVRFLCMSLLRVHPFAASTMAALAFSAAIAIHGRHQYLSFRAGHLDGGCPFSGRYRLQHRGRHGVQDLTVLAVCVFAAMPALYMVVPYIAMTALGSGGSALAGTLCTLSLVIGWSWRMFERFCLDGFAPMNLLHSLSARYCSPLSGSGRAIGPRKEEAGTCAQTTGRRALSFALTTGAAFLSPTAALHFFTGLTLLFGHAHARSVHSAL